MSSYWGLRTYKTEPIVWGNGEQHLESGDKLSRVNRYAATCEHEWGNEIPRAGYRSNDSHPGQIQSIATQNRNEVMSNFCLKCHAWKGELGLEPTVELYIEHLISIFNEVKRVLKKTGTCWVNLSDSYYASGGAHKPEHANPGLSKSASRNGVPRSWGNSDNIQPKSLCAIPERFMLAMVGNSWIVRNDIIWYKANPIPESVRDRFTGTYEHLYFFVKSRKYWFEQQFDNAITFDDTIRDRDISKLNNTPGRSRMAGLITNQYTQRNRRDVWEINTEPYKGSHFAVFPERLVETPILSGCPSQICTTVCTKCEKSGVIDNSCPDRESPGTVLDPFCGSGTTLSVAKRLNRKSIGIELNPDYCRLAQNRVSNVSIPMELKI